MRRGRPTPKQNSMISEDNQKAELPKVERLNLSAESEDPFMAVARTRSIPNLKDPEPSVSLRDFGSSTGNTSRTSLRADVSTTRPLSSLTPNPSDFGYSPTVYAQRPKSEGASLEQMWAFASSQPIEVSEQKKPTVEPPKPPRNRRAPPPPPPKRKPKDVGPESPQTTSDMGYAPLEDDFDELPSAGQSEFQDPFLDIAKSARPISSNK
ncbi:hypothetical protein BC829DRAFT_383038 [Chytridium lagenaria]|nr:hypothetical protein BC829DRAFT_383038 [Chytridium lagenaria]